MRLFLEFLKFELKFRFKSVSIYVYCAIWFAFSFLCIASENFGPIAAGNGKVLLNGPYANIYNDVFSTFFGLIIIGAIFGTSILRDFQRDTTQILFTKPITKFAYLGGRWAGSFIATAFAFSGLIFGELLGTLAPWADHTRIAPTHLWWYLQPFLSIVLVQVFFIGTIFFMVAALTRRIFIVYVQGAAFLIIYLIGLGAFQATRSTALFWPGIFDPVGVILNDSITRYWTVVDKNTMLYSWSLHSAGGVFLFNRILWIGVGLFSLGMLWKLFPMSLEALTARTSSKRARIALEQDEEVQPVRSRAVARIPLVQQFFGFGTALAQYLSLTRMRVRNVVRDVPFWVLLVLMAAVALNNGHYAGRVEGINVWPVTYLMLQAVEGGAALFFYIVATFYAAELIWRERDTHFEGIHDALPMREATDRL
jgi:ABC-2 type transport system permease protein